MTGTELARSAEPASVEFRVAGNIGSVPVQGSVDVMDVNGDIIDVKAASKEPSAVRADHRLQVATYAMLARARRGARGCRR